MNPIIIVGGDKGGTGKSLVCAWFIEFLRRRGRSVLVVDTDEQSCDVARAAGDYGSQNIGRRVVCLSGNMRRRGVCLWGESCGDWGDFLGALKEEEPFAILVNLATRTLDTVVSHKDELNAALAATGRDVHTLWVMGRDRYCFESLTTWCERVKPSATVDVVLNGFFTGDCPGKFRYYLECVKRRAATEGLGAWEYGKYRGENVLFLTLDPVVADAILGGYGVTLGDVMGDLKHDVEERREGAKKGLKEAGIRLAERVEAQHWFNAVKENFSALPWLAEV